MPRRERLPLAEAVLQLLVPHPQGVSVQECWQALHPQPAYTTVWRHLQRFCAQGLVVRVARGRYTLTTAFRVHLVTRPRAL